MPVVIQVENLSKYYRLGLIGGGTLREDLNRWWAKARGRPDPLLKIGATDHGNREGGELWALRDVNFRVREGEILGIIGRNGAGKSTLLKILSRITAPTSGQVKIKGRVGSLLEVGTGFHPELTGRENIYLNGVILGMKKAEIDRKLNEIIEFAEITQFIDTPVKRYSSGMYVRLAFAVAAHLEPEILVVDEVLAVGDVEFQKKCTGRMEAIAKKGRTVLFVSHNLQSIQSLCTRVVLLTNGSVGFDGSPAEACERYMGSFDSSSLEKAWDSGVTIGNSWFSLVRMRAFQSGKPGAIQLETRHPIKVEMEFDLGEEKKNLCVGFDLITSSGVVVLRSYQTDMEDSMIPRFTTGRNHAVCTLPAGLLSDGVYYIAPRVGVHNQEWVVYTEAVLQFHVTLSHGVSWYWAGLNQYNRPGVISPILNWVRVS